MQISNHEPVGDVNPEPVGAVCREALEQIVGMSFWEVGPAKDIARTALATSGPTLGLEEVGVGYCTTHHGVLNEDDHRCDFARDDEEPGEDGEPRDCTVAPLYLAVASWGDE